LNIPFQGAGRNAMDSEIIKEYKTQLTVKLCQTVSKNSVGNRKPGHRNETNNNSMTAESNRAMIKLSLIFIN
jgi:hypothetical protein